MNICFEMGKVIEDVNFDFMYEDKRISIAYTTLMLKNNAIIKIRGYGNIADIMYRTLQKNDNVMIQGRIICGKNIEIEVSRNKKNLIRKFCDFFN